MSFATKADRIASRTPINQRALLTTEMACDYLSIGRDLLDAFVRSKDIKGIPVGTGAQKRYRRSDLDELIEKMAGQKTNIDKARQ